ncbi:MAG: hypothetical protein ABR555_19975 [Pyrinomonadaceae bacterium]
MSKDLKEAAVFLLPAFIVMFMCASIATAQERRENVSYAPLTLNLTSDATVVSTCASTMAAGAQVKLNARAVSPGGNSIKYKWSITAGRIIGEGAGVVWDLTGAAPGLYKASVEAQTGNVDGECEAFSSTTVYVNPCAPVQLVCPAISITCPTNVVIDEPITFDSTLSGGSPVSNAAYNWTVSAGNIVEGQGTNTIKVDTKGLAGQTIAATVSVGGYPGLDCSANCVVQIPVPQLTCRKFDEFPAIARNDEKARLDNLVIDLQNDPTSTAYVRVSPGRDRKTADVQRHTSRILDYLVNSRGIDSRRIMTVSGPAKDQLMVELWSCPQGAPTPNP